MKLERISENQIRCTLNRNDLINRELKISELAYGSEKAKALFHDMMAQASDELGFEAEDIPLIIEAIPVSGDCVVLIITKVEDPEELDTRFARFTPVTDDEEEDDEDFDSSDDSNAQTYTGADEILDLFKRIQENVLADIQPSAAKKSDAPSKKTAPASEIAIEITRIFSFHSLSEVSAFAEAAHAMICGTNTLYKDEHTGRFYLVLHKGDATPEDFNCLCNAATEYGQREAFTYATTAYYNEHYTIMIKNQALQILAEL